jgi:hypothetical protein
LVNFRISLLKYIELITYYSRYYALSKIALLISFDYELLELSIEIARLVASSRVIEFELDSRLVKTQFESKILTQVFESSQRVDMKYLAYNSIQLVKTRKI